jgi:trehalose synthase
VAHPRDVEVPRRATGRLGGVIGERRLAALEAAAAQARGALGGAAVWIVSSTAAGGGVAEMLHLLVGYAEDIGIGVHWVVLEADPAFFVITKRLHNRLHGAAGDEGALGPEEARHYGAVCRDNARALKGRVRPGDVVILHDPQTAGLAAPLIERGARVAWRCHIGTDRVNARTEEAWAFLLPHLAACHTFVFSRPSYVPDALTGEDVRIIAPSIDPLSPKNRPLPRARVTALLARIGLLEGARESVTSAVVGGAAPLRVSVPLVVQVSRWDHLKDMAGVLQGFADRVARRDEARLALVGPAVAAVSDDPEGALVLQECTRAWEALPARARDTVRLVTLPMEDMDANALMVNAAQRHATVVVQKSLQEGFGLTVAEAMWKARPVLASAVGGIVDQVPPGTGVLLLDPTDLGAFGDALNDLLAHPEERARLGRAARRHVRAHYLTDRQLIDYASLLQAMTLAAPIPAPH